MLFYCSANRDEAVFDDPYRFDIGRTPNPHVGFGGPGPHFCLGAHLARREITVMFKELFTRVPDIRAVGEPDRLLSNFINGDQAPALHVHAFRTRRVSPDRGAVPETETRATPPAVIRSPTTDRLASVAEQFGQPAQALDAGTEAFGGQAARLHDHQFAAPDAPEPAPGRAGGPRPARGRAGRAPLAGRRSPPGTARRRTADGRARPATRGPARA